MLRYCGERGKNEEGSRKKVKSGTDLKNSKKTLDIVGYACTGDSVCDYFFLYTYDRYRFGI